VLWSDDFEDGLGEWSVEGGTWAVGNQVYNTEPIPVSGTQHAGTVIGGEYGTGRDARLISPELTVPSASQGPRFRFAYWYQFAAGDYGRVQVRTLGGDWEDAPGAALTNDAAGWAQSIVDLRKYAGSVVQIALRFVSDDQHAPRWGWYVDDAAFEVGRRPLGDLDDFESGFGDWSVEGGAWARSIQRFNTEPVAPSGTNYVGTAPGSEYGINTDARLISPEYPVPPASAAPKFRFSYWYQFGAGDYGQVQLRVLGDDWQDVAGGRIEQENGSWSQQVVDLRPYAGQTVQIGLRFVSDDQHTPRWGWYVDDAGFESR